MKSKSIVLGGGCFWCLEAAYQQLKGVTSVVSGYSGGPADEANYNLVVGGGTGHVEVVEVTFDTDMVNLTTILAVFWTIHDATSLDRQGADVGPQYASVIFYKDENDVSVIEASQAEAQSKLDDPIVTRVQKLDAFYPAEPYHQDYYRQNSYAGYCQVVIEPKLAKLRQHFAPLLNT
ncbi:MAG TPA: peptide-methionine (S)-S-oxide reductase MsrA [Candidatus Saccharimonadales bacterium]|jgi:peptide-methionine (S)-S-oxide reductase